MCKGQGTGPRLPANLRLELGPEAKPHLKSPGLRDLKKLDASQPLGDLWFGFLNKTQEALFSELLMR